MPPVKEFEGLPPALFWAIVAQAPDAMIFAGRDGIIQVWNHSAARIFDYTADEVIGKNLDIIIPERLRCAHWAGFDKAVETGKTKYAGRVLTTRAERKNGGKLYVDLSFSLITNSAGTVSGVLAIARDCTERYLAATAARH